MTMPNYYGTTTVEILLNQVRDRLDTLVSLGGGGGGAQLNLEATQLDVLAELQSILVELGNIEALLTTIDADTSNISSNTNLMTPDLDDIRIAIEALQADFEAMFNVNQKTVTNQIRFKTGETVFDAKFDESFTDTTKTETKAKINEKWRVSDISKVTYNVSQSSLRISTNGANTKEFVQSRYYIPYQPGKEIRATITGNLSGGYPGSCSRIGLFDDHRDKNKTTSFGGDGFFFLSLYNPSGVGNDPTMPTTNNVGFPELFVVLRRWEYSANPAAAIPGTLEYHQVDIMINQDTASKSGRRHYNNTTGAASWAVDASLGFFNGTYTQIDHVTSQFFVIEYIWQGVGPVRFGLLNPDTHLFTYCHTFYNENINVGPYCRTGTLPVRFEIENTTYSGLNDTYIDMQCVDVESEGGYNPRGVTRNAEWYTLINESTKLNSIIIPNDDNYHCIGKLRLKTSHSRYTINPIALTVLLDTAGGARACEVRLILNPVFSAAGTYGDATGAGNWKSIGPATATEQQFVTGGSVGTLNTTPNSTSICVGSELITDNGDSQLITEFHSPMSMGSSISGTPDELGIFVRTAVSATFNIIGVRFQYQELY